MAKFALLLGRTPALSQQEWSALYSGQSTVVANRFIFFEVHPQKAEQLFSEMGGALKLLEILPTTGSDLEMEAVRFLFEQDIETFSSTSLIKDVDLDAGTLKKALRAQGRSSRFIEGDEDGLSAAVLLHQNVAELLAIPGENEATPVLAKTVKVQDIDDWSHRDRQKPYFDRKKGMLPPKVARMMVNIATGTWRQLHSDQQPGLLYDPFCGTGTVLLESAMLHVPATGSDLDPEAVMGATRNIAWLKQSYNLNIDMPVFVADATNVKLPQVGRKVDVLVTEPFLGKPAPKPDQLPNIFKGLEKLYLGCFKQLATLLNDGAIVTMVMPLAKIGNRVYSLESLVDKIAQFGYTPHSEPADYFRPQAIIHRQIWTFRFQKN